MGRSPASLYGIKTTVILRRPCRIISFWFFLLGLCFLSSCGDSQVSSGPDEDAGANLRSPDAQEKDVLAAEIDLELRESGKTGTEPSINSVGEVGNTLPDVGPDVPLDGSALDDPAQMSEDEFLAAYADIEDVVIHESGLMYRVITAGSGASPDADQRVRVQYRGTLMNGEVFDQTLAGRTSEFRVGSLIRGWQVALPLMKEGATWELIVPSFLAYGERGTDDGSIGANQTLLFEITLVEVVED